MAAGFTQSVRFDEGRLGRLRLNQPPALPFVTELPRRTQAVRRVRTVEGPGNPLNANPSDRETARTVNPR